MSSRRFSRAIVLQSLYEWDFWSKKVDLKTILERNTKEFGTGRVKGVDFIFWLADTVVSHLEEIDKIIKERASQRPFDQMNIIDRNVLRIGLAEFLYGRKEKIPPKVAINEAVELAKTFGGENSGRFVNGVLGGVYKDIKEKDEKF